MRLTEEQQLVVRHPLGRHATVSGTPGCGKTATLIARIVHMVRELHVAPDLILVVMFNRDARLAFKERLGGILKPHEMPEIHTFHSFCYAVAGWTQRELGFANRCLWEDSEIVYHVHTVVRTLVKDGDITAAEGDLVNAENVADTIALWKSKSLSPKNAGHRLMPDVYPAIYEWFEEVKKGATAVTFDDFAPRTVWMLNNLKTDTIRLRWCRYKHILIDEYQDVNYSQQLLIETLADIGDADVMAIGDDSQCIYEFRGARPYYLRRGFKARMSSKPLSEYRLSHSFRAGPVICQAAQNVISHNTDRVPSQLVAHNADRFGEVTVITENSTATLCRRVVDMVQRGREYPSEIMVLGRTYGQLGSTEAWLLGHQVPYVIEGREPFFERPENAVLLTYLRLATQLSEPLTEETSKQVLRVLNTPNRKLPRHQVEIALRTAQFGERPLHNVVSSLLDGDMYPSQKDQLIGLMALLNALSVRASESRRAYMVLEWLIEALGYEQHFTDFFGNGVAADERIQSVHALIDYARDTGLDVSQFLAHITDLDTTRGEAPDQVIKLTTVFKVKGLEANVVIIPDCIEGFMPVLRENGDLTYDKQGLVPDIEAGDVLEAERRLFYVAISRARRLVLIGSNDGRDPNHVPSRFLDELQLEPTVAIMTQLQRVEAGVDGAAQDLLHAVREHGGHKSILRTLLSRYLKQQVALAGKVATTGDTCSEVAFGYRNAHKGPVVHSQNEPPAPLGQGWINVKI